MVANSLLKAVSITFMLIVGTMQINAQSAAAAEVAVIQNSQQKTDRAKNEFSVLVGWSISSPTLIGTTEDARLGALALRYGRDVFSKKNVALQYGVEITPVAALSLPNRTFARRRELVYGIGVSPVGFKLNFRKEKRLQPFAGTSGGLFYFTKDVPVINASKFNFTFDFGGGVQIFTRNKRAVTIGYKYQHISNGGTARVNPGIDANIFYVGVSVFK